MTTPFVRDDSDLRVTVPVDLYTALLGGKAEVPTLEGSVNLTIPAETSNGQTIRLRGLGCPTCVNRRNGATCTPPLTSNCRKI
jgi:DnaJ-class molecular chaperone